MFSDLELLVFELHQSKRKWLLLGIYKPPSQNVIEFLNRISLIIDYYLQTYENILAIGDFNLSVDNSHLEAFMQAYDFSSLIKKPTCYQSNTPSCMDLICSCFRMVPSAIWEIFSEFLIFCNLYFDTYLQSC